MICCCDWGLADGQDTDPAESASDPKRIDLDAAKTKQSWLKKEKKNTRTLHWIQCYPAKWNVTEVQSSYQFLGVPSLRCCHQGWSVRSGPQAGRGGRYGVLKSSCCWGSRTPPSHCHSNFAERSRADLARDWLWRTSLCDAGAAIERKEGPSVTQQSNYNFRPQN